MYAYTYIFMYGVCESVQYAYMGWLRSVGSIKLKVSFAEYRLFYRALLQKRPVISCILLTESTPGYMAGFECCVSMRMPVYTHPCIYICGVCVSVQRNVHIYM